VVVIDRVIKTNDEEEVEDVEVTLFIVS